MPQWNLNQNTLQSDRAGGGAAEPVVYWVKEVVCVIVYHISIDHSHLSWKH